MTLESIASEVSWYVSALDYITKATPFFLIACGLLAYYYREKIKSIIAKSAAKEIEELKSKLSLELSQQQARLQRELEAYKVSLISETERVKASQDLKKSIALKFYEKRFSAISNILDAHAGLDTDLVVLVTMECDSPVKIQLFNKLFTDFAEKLNAYSKAYSASLVFISQDLRNSILKYRTHCINIMSRRTSSDIPALEKNCKEIEEVFELSVSLDTLLTNSVELYENI